MSPRHGEAEVGLGLVARGTPPAASPPRPSAALLLDTDPLGVSLRASGGPDNAASLRILARCGFTELRGSTDAGHLRHGEAAAGGR